MDERLFRASIGRFLEYGLRDLYVFGTAGEGYAVGERQFDEVVGIFVDEVHAAGASPMVGVISLSLSTVVDRIERCASQGVELFQISLPSWAALSTAEVFTFFDETFGRFPHLRFLHYNLGRTNRLVTPTEYAELAERHPNLIATKNAGANYETVAALFREAGELRHFLTEPAFAYGSLIGPCGLLVSVASINPVLARAFFEAGVNSDVHTLRRMTGELAAIDSDLEQALGTMRIDGVYDKCFNKLHVPDFPLELLPPYEGATDQQYQRFVNGLRERYPHWLPGELVRD